MKSYAYDKIVNAVMVFVRFSTELLEVY